MSREKTPPDHSGDSNHPDNRDIPSTEERLEADLSPDTRNKGDDADPPQGISRRQFIKTGSAGLVAGALVSQGLTGLAMAAPGQGRGPGGGGPPGGPPRGGPPGIPPGRADLILIKGGTVMSMDPTIGDFEVADVLIEGSKIVEVRPNISASAAFVVDAKGMVVLPGFIDTHHHQYETIQRSIIADGNLQWAAQASFTGELWPQESYGSVVQAIWTTGRMGSADNPIWDIGRSPYDPEDNYISELLASVSQINQGVTTGVDTSQNSHTPEHTDAMIQGLMDSGRRTLFAYAGGRSDTPGYEFPGAIGNETHGLGRLRREWFNSDDQLVTLGHTGGPREGWELARAFDAVVVNHNNSIGQNLIENQDLLEQFANEGRHIEQIHCARFTPEAYDICAEFGVHISIANITEMQMGHGMPPFQACLDRGILPSLSADVDTNNTPDPFSLMRNAFALQRALIHQRALPLNLQGDPSPMTGGVEDPSSLPFLLTSHQVIEMATYAGAVTAGLGDKVGTLTPGKEADIVLLNARSPSTWPMNNVPGTVVTMMDTSHVDTVFVAGKVKKWRGQLVGVDIDKLLDEIELARERVLAKINGPATGSNPNAINEGLNSEGNPYRPAYLPSCCIGPDNVGVYSASPGTGG
ncbi:amidohydrolase family protein [Methylonatrum kenyense]|uniref:amidohydrolase family protein n=1 Tax=Methylonatrum kenyense TaxID=455253 RepID=UPI0020BE1129|nr:amidohydrolase family protein [Methylonatrum kenyense]MCK8517275.1 amidohydrolase family protein [Methylonatrum kenyense]